MLTPSQLQMQAKWRAENAARMRLAAESEVRLRRAREEAYARGLRTRAGVWLEDTLSDGEGEDEPEEDEEEEEEESSSDEEESEEEEEEEDTSSEESEGEEESD
jgi:hypothetical protein